VNVVIFLLPCGKVSETKVAVEMRFISDADEVM
jgi:hypothetical protein